VTEGRREGGGVILRHFPPLAAGGVVRELVSQLSFPSFAPSLPPSLFPLYPRYYSSSQ